LRKQSFLICLITLSLFSSVLASAQIKSTTALPEQTDELQAVTSNLPVDLGGSHSASAVDEAEPTDPQQADNGGQDSAALPPVDTASGNTGVGTGPGTAAGTAPTSSATAPAPTAVAYTFPTGSEMTHYWIRNVVGPRAGIGATFNASWKTWVSTSPTEWHRDAEGWFKRFGTSLLDNSINQSSLVLLSRAMGQDPRYYRCECSGVWPRTRHAVALGFTARNHSGDKVFSPAKIIAPFTGPLVTRSTIYPDSFGPGDAFTGSAGVYFLVGGVAWNLIREFIWPTHL